MSDAAVSDTVRLTLRGAGPDADLVVPRAALVADVVREYAEATGLPQPLTLSTTTGRRLHVQRSVRQCGVGDGDIVVVTASHGDTKGGAQGSSAGAGADGWAVPGVGPAGWLVAVCVVTATLAASLAQPGGLRTGAAALLLLASVAAALPWTSGAPAALGRAVAPVFGAGGAFAAVDRSGPGGLLLAVVVGALAAAAVAALARAMDPREDHEVTVVWVCAGGVVAVLAVAVLLLGAPALSLWAVLFTLAVVVARWLPYLTVDVPDQALLDLDRLAITAWSAREMPRPGRRRTMVREESVATLVRRGRRLLSAGVVAVAVVMAVTAPALASAPGDDLLTRIGVYVLVLCGGGAVALASRFYRAQVPRLVLRLCGAWVLAFLVAAFVSEAGATTVWVLTIGTVLLAVPTVVAGVGLGRGWRSLWWARTGDLAGGLCVVLAIGVLPLASGLFAFVRQMTSS